MPSTTEMMLKSLKLEDYDEITFDPTQESRDDKNNHEDFNAANRVRRESENDEEIETTTVGAVESSTLAIHATSQEDFSSSNQVVVSSMLQLPNNNPPQHFQSDKYANFYKPSSNPQAQFVSITTNMPPTLKNYYDFYPSQPDFYYNRNYFNYMPHAGLCNVGNQQNFVPVAYNYVRRYWR